MLAPPAGGCASCGWAAKVGETAANLTICSRAHMRTHPSHLFGPQILFPLLSAHRRGGPFESGQQPGPSVRAKWGTPSEARQRHLTGSVLVGFSGGGGGWPSVGEVLKLLVGSGLGKEPSWGGVQGYSVNVWSSGKTAVIGSFSDQTMAFKLWAGPPSPGDAGSRNVAAIM